MCPDLLAQAAMGSKQLVVHQSYRYAKGRVCSVVPLNEVKLNNSLHRHLCHCTSVDQEAGRLSYVLSHQ